MNTLREPSLQSSLESNRGSNDSLLADSLQLDIEEVDMFFFLPNINVSLERISQLPPQHIVYLYIFYFKSFQ